MWRGDWFLVPGSKFLVPDAMATLTDLSRLFDFSRLSEIMNSKLVIDICLTPNSYPYYRMDNCIVVVVDVFRATSAFCTAIAHGVKGIIPMADVEETRAYRQKGYLIAGERNGVKLEGFDFGNSPYDFMKESLKGENIAFTTTNGTQAIERVKGDAQHIVVGSFLNISALVKWLQKMQCNVLFLCAGWKNAVNLEDTLFAGIAMEQLLSSSQFTAQSDTVALAQMLCGSAQGNLMDFLCASSSTIRGRMSTLGKDFRFCLQNNQYDVVPIYHNGQLVDVSNIKGLH